MMLKSGYENNDGDGTQNHNSDGDGDNIGIELKVLVMTTCFAWSAIYSLYVSSIL